MRLPPLGLASPHRPVEELSSAGWHRVLSRKGETEIEPLQRHMGEAKIFRAPFDKRKKGCFHPPRRVEIVYPNWLIF